MCDVTNVLFYVPSRFDLVLGWALLWRQAARPEEEEARSRVARGKGRRADGEAGAPPHQHGGERTQSGGARSRGGFCARQSEKWEAADSARVGWSPLVDCSCGLFLGYTEEL